MAFPVRRLGYLHLEQNDIEQVRFCFLQSLDLNREVGDKRAIAASLLAMAAVAEHLDRPELATRLYGAVENQLDWLAIKLLPLDEAESVRTHNQLHTILDQATFESAYAEGWEMSEEQTVALAEGIR